MLTLQSPVSLSADPLLTPWKSQNSFRLGPRKESQEEAVLLFVISWRAGSNAACSSSSFSSLTAQPPDSEQANLRGAPVTIWLQSHEGPSAGSGPQSCSGIPGSRKPRGIMNDHCFKLLHWEMICQLQINCKSLHCQPRWCSGQESF